MADRVEVDGYAQLAADTVRLAAAIEDQAGEAFGRVAGQVATTVRARVPHRSGLLASTVRSDEGDGQATVRMGGSLPYAGVIEHGGYHGPPYSAAGYYFGPAATAAEPLITAAAEAAARTEIGRMRWSNPAH